MRIAFFVDRFPVISQTFVLRQITGLIDLGHSVDVYAQRDPDGICPIHPEVDAYGLRSRVVYTDRDMPLATGYWQQPVWPVTGKTWLPGAEQPIWNVGRIVKALPVFARCLKRAPGVTLHILNPREYGYQARSLATLYRLSALASQRGGYDVLHAHFGPVGNTFRFARPLWEAPMIVSFHGYDYTTWPRKEGGASYIRLFRAVDTITVNSDYARGRLQELGCPPSKLHHLPYGVNLDDFAFQERATKSGELVRILTVARLVEKKGVEYSIRAIGIAREQFPNLRYDIVGEGPLRPALEALVHRLGLQDTVIFHGARDGNDVRQLMAGAHLFVLSSVTAADGDQEGTPVSLLEAQACGLPALSTAHSGIPEIVLDGCSGFVLPERDAIGLADRLCFLLHRPEIWPAMGREGRRQVESHHDIRKLNSELASLYRAVIEQSRELARTDGRI